MAKNESLTPRVDFRSNVATRGAVAWGIGLAAALRIGLGLCMGLAWWAVGANIWSGWLRDPSVYGQLQMPVSRLGQSLLGVWPRWDAVQHLTLAMRGYSGMSEGATLFYPLYAGVTRVVAQAIGNDFITAGLAVSTLAAAAAFALILLLGQRLYGPAAGRWAAIALAIYPASVLLLAPFTESLFLALTLGAFLGAYRGKWLVAAALAALASLTRASGVTASVAFAFIAWDQLSAPGAKRLSRNAVAAVVAIIAPVAAGAAFLAWRSAAGFAPISAVLREHVGTRFVDPLTGIALALRQWFLVHDFPTTLDVLSAALFLGVTASMIARRRWRRPELVAYMLVNMLVLLARRTEGASSLKSMARYVLVLFPAYLVAGDWLASSRPSARFWYALGSTSLLILLSILYVFWFFLG